MDKAFYFYIDDIMITGQDATGLKVYLSQKEGSDTNRTQSGTLFKTVAWTKFSVKVVASGLDMLPALNGLDYSFSMPFHSPIRIANKFPASSSLILSYTYRREGIYHPRVFGVLASGFKEPRSSVMGAVGTKELTVNLLGNEESLVVLYYPVYTMFFSPPNIDWNEYPAESSWSIEGEEV